MMTRTSETGCITLQSWCQILRTGFPGLRQIIHIFRTLRFQCAQDSHEQCLPSAASDQQYAASSCEGGPAAAKNANTDEQNPDSEVDKSSTAADKVPCESDHTDGQKRARFVSQSDGNREWPTHSPGLEASTSSSVQTPMEKQLRWHSSEQKSTPRSSLTHLRRPTSAASVSYAQRPGNEQHHARQSFKVNKQRAVHNADRQQR